MNDVFQELPTAETVRSLRSAELGPRLAWSPFFEEPWGRVLMAAFPYLKLRRFVYRDTHMVRVAQIGNRITSVPFSDGGDVVSLSGVPLDLELFRTGLIERFGKEVMVRVHEGLASVAPTDITADIVDFRVDLTSFSIDSVRKTLRHILDAGLSQGSEIRMAVPADVERIYKLYLGTMHEAAGIALPREVFDDLMHRDVFVFVNKGRIEAVSVFFADNTSAFHFISASSKVGKELHAPHHLLFHAIKHYQQAGKQSLFLGGTNAGSSLRTFKEGWRGDECKIYTISGSSAHEAARQSPLRSLWKLIPASLLPKATKLVGRRVF